MKAENKTGDVIQRAQAPELPSPIVDSAAPIPDTTMQTTSSTAEPVLDVLPSTESVNYLTKLTMPWDVGLFLAAVALTLVATNFFFRWEIRNDASPGAAYSRQSWIAYASIGLAAFVCLLPHTGENAAGLFDLITKFSWPWLLIGTAVLAVLALLSSLHRRPQDSTF